MKLFCLLSFLKKIIHEVFLLTSFSKEVSSVSFLYLFSFSKRKQIQRVVGQQRLGRGFGRRNRPLHQHIAQHVVDVILAAGVHILRVYAVVDQRRQRAQEIAAAVKDVQPRIALPIKGPVSYTHLSNGMVWVVRV